MGKALIIKGADFSQVAVDTIDIAVGQPTISIDLFGNVTITSPNGEDIYYTTDGSTPNTASTKYTAGFVVQMNTTVKAVCYLGGNYSEVASVHYDGTLQAPTINITNKGVVTITATNNASIRYTVNGADPTSSSGTIYSGTFNVENGDVVKAIAYIHDGTSTISSSVTTSDPAVVPESVLFGKAFELDTSGTLNVPTGNLINDATRWISPKIPITGEQSFDWYHVGSEYTVDFCVEYTSADIINEYWNVHPSYPTDTTSKTSNRGTTYLRVSGKIGSEYAGAYVMIGGVKVFEYNGETE